MDNKLQNIAAVIADKLFLPVNIEYKNYFAIPLRFLVIIFFIYSGVIAIPTVIEWVKATSFYLPWIDIVLKDKQFWGLWLPYINFILEILFFLMIGGSVFSEWAVSHSKNIIDKYEAAMELAKKGDIEEAREGLAKGLREYYSLLDGINIRNFLSRMRAMYTESRSVINLLLHDVAKVNAKFLATKLAVSFPGGFYGLFAFLLFAALIQVKVAQFYLMSNASG